MELSPEYDSPHVTTNPSSRIAANALDVACTYTFLSWLWTAELSPPKRGLPHVTTEPSARIAANAVDVEYTSCTSLSLSWTAEESPPARGWPHVTTDLFKRGQQQMQTGPLQAAGRSSADLGLLSYPHQNLDCPK